MARTSKEFQAFDSLMDRLLTVSKTELDRRQAEYRKGVDENPRRRGPKRKITPSAADHDEDASSK